MNINRLLQSKRIRTLLVLFGALAILLLVFEAGEMVGYHKASFSERWGGNYSRMFGAHRGGFAPELFRNGEFSAAHGASGKIIRADLPMLTLADQDGIEKNILVTDDSIVRRFRETVMPSDIRTDDFAVVIGSPNDAGQIEARFIRLLTAAPPDFSAGTATAPSLPVK